MENCDIENCRMYFEFFGTIISTIIGGLIAYKIAKYQIKRLEKQQEVKEKKLIHTNDIQLLWQMYFDIKKDCENSKLWIKYEELLNSKGKSNNQTSNSYIYETLEYIILNIRDLFKLLKSKERELNGQQSNELNLLWQRLGQLTIFMTKIFEALNNNDNLDNSKIFKLLTEANELLQNHTK